MAKEALHEQIATMRKALLEEELLDFQFLQLENLESDNPTFLANIFNIFFVDTTKTLETIGQMLETTPADFDSLEKTLHMMKGNSSSVGANKVKIEVNQMREHCQAKNLEGCQGSFQRLKEQHGDLKQKLETYFGLVKEAAALEKADDPDHGASSSAA